MKNKNLQSEQLEYHEGSNTWSPKKDFLIGKIDFQYNENQSLGEPLIVIEGIEISWDEFARTILIHEGFYFRLKFIDPADILSLDNNNETDNTFKSVTATSQLH